MFWWFVQDEDDRPATYDYYELLRNLSGPVGYEVVHSGP